MPEVRVLLNNKQRRFDQVISREWTINCLRGRSRLFVMGLVMRWYVLRDLNIPLI